MFIIRVPSLLCVGLLFPLTQAWSVGGGGPASDRRGFLVQTASKAAVVVGTASIGVNEVIGVERAQAATTIYQPSPGSLVDQVHVITGASTGLGVSRSLYCSSYRFAQILTILFAPVGVCKKIGCCGGNNRYDCAYRRKGRQSKGSGTRLS